MAREKKPVDPDDPNKSGPGKDLVRDPAQRLARSSGLSRPKRVGRMNFAATIQDEIPVIIYTRYWAAIWMGHNAKLAQDARCTSTNGYTVVWNDQFGLGNPEPTLDQRNEAARELQLRGYGQPAQHVQIEAEVRSMGDSGSSESEFDELEGMFGEALLDEIMGRLELAGAPKKKTALPVAAQAPVDAELVDPVTTPAEGADLEETAPLVQPDPVT